VPLNAAVELVVMWFVTRCDRPLRVRYASLNWFKDRRGRCFNNGATQ